MDNFKDHWKPEPPQSDWWWLIIGALILIIILGMVGFAFAHIKDRPDLDTWFNSLISKGGFPCCAHIDGSTIADVDWDTTVVEGKVQYRVHIDGQWIVVSDTEVVTSPNKYGPAMAWVYRSDGKPQIRCFLPGAGG